MEVDEKYLNAVESKNLSIIEQLSNTRFVYKRKSCGHTFESNIANIIHGKVVFCKQCSEEKIKNSEYRFGLRFVEKIDNVRNKYLVENCGHQVDMLKHNLINRENFECPVCEYEKFLTSLDAAGFELLEYRTTDIVDRVCKNKMAKVRFKSCGHTINTIRKTNMQVSPCPVCNDINRTNIYLENGLIFVSKITRVKSLFRFVSCGHERVFYNSAAIRGNCLCVECNDSPFAQKSKIYILKIHTLCGESFIKFGYGKNIKNRVREYRLKNVDRIDVLLDIDIDSGFNAMKIEKAVHSLIKEFALPIEYTRKFLTKGGFTECYPSDMFDTIGEELRKYNV